MNVIQATRRHYAMLQHKKAPDRIALDYEVTAGDGSLIQGARLWVKASTEAQRKATLTRTVNVLLAMFPEARSVHASYQD